jgi:hypothetical protein
MRAKARKIVSKSKCYLFINISQCEVFKQNKETIYKVIIGICLDKHVIVPIM